MGYGKTAVMIALIEAARAAGGAPHATAAEHAKKGEVGDGLIPALRAPR
eukprot:gene6997-19998_t